MPRFDEPGVRFDDPLVQFDDPRSYQEILNTQLMKPIFDVVLDLNKLSVPAFIERTRSILTATSKVPVFASLATKIAALDAKVDILEGKQFDLRTAENAVTMATNARDDTQKEVLTGANEIAAEIGKLATTEAEVESTLLRVKSQPAPKPVPDQPTGLELSMGDEEGELSGQCNGQPGVIDFLEIQFTTGDPLSDNPNWQHASISKKSRFDLPGLPSGQKVWVRLRACNSRGKSPWCDPACKRVP